MKNNERQTVKPTINEAADRAEEYFTNTSNDLGREAVKEIRSRVFAGNGEFEPVVDQLLSIVGDEAMKNRIQPNMSPGGRQFKFSLNAPLQACLSVAAKVTQLKNRLVARLSAEAKDWLPENLFRQAFVEAEALAWSTSFPLLFLPALAEEKVRNVEQWAGRQRQIMDRGNFAGTF